MCSVRRAPTQCYAGPVRAEQRVIAEWLERTREAHGLNWKTWAEKVRLKFGVSMAETTLSRAVKDDFTSVMSVPTLDVLARSIDEPSVLDFLAGKAAGADTPPPAWIPKVETIEALLGAVRPALLADPLPPRSLQIAASAFCSALQSLAEHPSSEDNPDELGRVLTHIAFAIQPYTPPPSSPKTSTQRHKSDKP